MIEYEGVVFRRRIWIGWYRNGEEVVGIINNGKEVEMLFGLGCVEWR